MKVSQFKNTFQSIFILLVSFVLVQCTGNSSMKVVGEENDSTIYETLSENSSAESGSQTEDSVSLEDEVVLTQSLDELIESSGSSSSSSSSSNDKVTSIVTTADNQDSDSGLTEEEQTEIDAHQDTLTGGSSLDSSQVDTSVSTDVGSISVSDGSSNSETTDENTETSDETDVQNSETSDEESETSTLTVSNPCASQSEYAYAVLFTSDKDGLVGCAGSSSGSTFITSDGGKTWNELSDEDTGMTGFSDMRVYDIDTDSDGNLYICGFNNDAASTVYLYKYSPTDLTYTVLLDETNKAFSTQGISSCGGVAVVGNKIIVDSLTSYEVVVSEDGGSTWARDEVWEEANLDLDADASDFNELRSVYQMWRTLKVGNDFYGVGSHSSDNPRFYKKSTHSKAGFHNMKVHKVRDDINGIARGLASPSCGETWIAGGKNADVTTTGSGFLSISENGGETWSEVSLPSPSSEDYTFDVVQDIKCHSSGAICYAVGHKYPESQGGFILYSTDKGKSWSELSVFDTKGDLIKLATLDDGSAWFFGDYHIYKVSLDDRGLTDVDCTASDSSASEDSDSSNSGGRFSGVLGGKKLKDLINSMKSVSDKTNDKFDDVDFDTGSSYDIEGIADQSSNEDDKDFNITLDKAKTFDVNNGLGQGNDENDANQNDEDQDSNGKGNLDLYGDKFENPNSNQDADTSSNSNLGNKDFDTDLDTDSNDGPKVDFSNRGTFDFNKEDTTYSKSAFLTGFEFSILNNRKGAQLVDERGK